MKIFAWLAALSLTGAAMGQAPWPLERQDRWGTARAPTGPAPEDYGAPWIFRVLDSTHPVSHGPSIAEDGTGYFGTWVNNWVYKFDTRTGDIADSFQALGFVACTPAVGRAGRLFASKEAPDGRVYALDRATMEFDWFHSDAGYIAGSPIVGPDGDVVFGSGAGSVFRRDDVSGAIVWMTPVSEPPRWTLCFSRDDALVFQATGNSITALRYDTGEVVWTTPLGSAAGAPGVAPDGTVVLGTFSGWVYGLNPATGAIRWSRQTLAEVKVAPAFSAHGVAYVGSYDFRLYAINVADGSRPWTFTGSYWITHAPVVGHDGRIYFLNQQGDLYCLLPSGALLWQMRLGATPYYGSITLGPDGTLYVPQWDSPNGGLFIIRQLPLTQSATGFSLFRGQLISGGLAEIGGSDGQHMDIQSGLTLNVQESPITLRVDAFSPLSAVRELRFRIEAHANIAGLLQAVDLFDYVGGAWVSVEARPASVGSDSALTILVSNPNRFIQVGTRAMRAQIRYRPNGPISTSTWRAKIDQLQWRLTP